jgi:broad specificity phosphatase PhoE
MRKLRMIMVRHGDPIYETDTLTEWGFIEAEMLSRYMRDNEKGNISCAYLSPQGRAQDTARPTIEKLGIPSETLPWMAENWVFGRLKEQESREPDLLDDDKFLQHPFMTERDGHLQKYHEVDDGLKALLKKYGIVRSDDGYTFRFLPEAPEGVTTIALFGHGGTGIQMLANLLHMSSVRLVETVGFETTSMTEIVIEEKERGYSFPMIARLNDNIHKKIYLKDLWNELSDEVKQRISETQGIVVYGE